ncbi:MAG: hypothetical protein FWG30_09765 [Eubacteriaceae bacterium]|nr:hypothetical protein [Eubacteriaceae bacterium]
MSIPEFSDLPENYTFEQSILSLLASIALEEIGLSHIINAEGEKLQYVVGTGPKGGPTANPTVKDILTVNESISETLKTVSFNQMFLGSKMSDAMKAYIQYKMMGGGSGGDGGGGDGNGGGGDGEIPPAVVDPPLISSPAITLGTNLTGDTVEWLEIARYTLRGEEYCLIVRKHFINIIDNNLNNPAYQFAPFGVNNNYEDSSVRSYINRWFNYQDGFPDFLSPFARIRDYTYENDALGVLGTGNSGNGGLANGYSKPTGSQYGDGIADIAFALSFTEAANFMSYQYATSSAGGAAPSTPGAAANFSAFQSGGKGIPIADTYGMWLRNPGSNVGTIQTAGSLENNGRAFQANISPVGEKPLVFPALWVNADIYNLPDS